MTVYRICHLPTGLFFCPSRELQVKLDGKSRYVKSNLSRRGRLYTRRPSLSWLGSVYYTHLITSWQDLNNFNSCSRPVIDTEWQIQEVES